MKCDGSLGPALRPDGEDMSFSCEALLDQEYPPGELGRRTPSPESPEACELTGQYMLFESIKLG